MLFILTLAGIVLKEQQQPRRGARGVVGQMTEASDGQPGFYFAAVQLQPSCGLEQIAEMIRTWVLLL